MISSLKGAEGAESGYVWMAAHDPPLESIDRYPVERMEGVRFSWMPWVLPPDDLVEVVLATTSPQLAPWNQMSEMSGMRSLIGGVPSTYGTALRAALHQRLGTHEGAAHVRVLEQELFWQKASEWDQGFFQKRPSDGFSCSIIEPKLRRLKEARPELFQA